MDDGPQVGARRIQVFDGTQWRDVDLTRRRDPSLIERNQLMVKMAMDGVPLQEVGVRFGMTREGVRQVLFRERAFAEWKQRRQEFEEQRRQERKAAEAEKRRAVCKVCGAEFVSRNRSATCSSLCAEALQVARRYLDPKNYDAHRRAVARVTLRDPKSTDNQRAFSQRVLDGTAPDPNRRYVVPGSKVSEILRKVGREDLIPANNPPHPETQPCRAINYRDGQPCRRRAVGGLCHIHAAARS